MIFNIDNQNLRLIDLGEARIYIDEKKNFLPFVENDKKEMRGNLSFSSKYKYLTNDLFPRDDLISLGYNFLHSLKKILPWNDSCRIADPKVRYSQVYKHVSYTI
jgi:hypothetical protein